MLVCLKIIDVLTLILQWTPVKLCHKMAFMHRYNPVCKQMTNIVNLTQQIKGASNINN